jgi:putative glutamine amidotransferase
MTRVVVTLARPAPAQVGKRALYLSALERAGAEVIPVFPGERAPDDHDALLLSGGGDIHPRRYGEDLDGSNEIDEERDELELSLVRRAIDARRPVLGICRGFQVLNVALGGSLVQHREGHRATAGEGLVRHDVTVASPSLLASAIGRGPLGVNSWHHQGITRERLAPGLVPTVVVDDLIEAFEAKDGWLVAVQWHPERVAEVDAAAARIFDAFIAAAR